MRRWLGLAVAGAVGGAACDQIHVRSSVLTYAHPWLAGQAWWVAPQFGVAVCLMVAASVPVARVSARHSPRPDPTEVAGQAAWFLVAYGATGVFGAHHAVLVASVLAVAWAGRIVTRSDRWPLLVASLLLAGGGVLYEGTLAGTGAFHYTHPDVYHVPWWLAGIYLQGAPLLVSVARVFSVPGRGVTSAVA
jgi:hypothetical protein